MKPAAGRIAALLARPALACLLDALDGDGQETRIVGGAVRNLLLGEPLGDIDLATTALPRETIARGKAAGFKAVPTGIDHGTVTLLRDGAGFEVTTLRRDVETDGRHAKVAFGRDFGEDAARRDFTVNALFLDRAGAIHDPCGGLADLAARRIRFIGDARRRIAEDHLRILRFFRFHAQYGHGEPDRIGLAAATAGRAGLDTLSRERVRAETMKLLVAPGAARALEAMAGAGLLMPVLGGVPHLSRFRAIALSQDAGCVDPAFRLAALAAMVGEDALRLRDRLRLSNTEFERIAGLTNAMEAVAGRPGLPALEALRHLALRTGTDAVAGALMLIAASAPPARHDEARELIADLSRTPPFRLSGRDLLARGVPAGPKIGLILEAARALWIAQGCPEGRAEQQPCLDRALEHAEFTRNPDVIPGLARDPS